jgi:hypothetical protein
MLHNDTGTSMPSENKTLKPAIICKVSCFAWVASSDCHSAYQKNRTIYLNTNDNQHMLVMHQDLSFDMDLIQKCG